MNIEPLTKEISPFTLPWIMADSFEIFKFPIVSCILKKEITKIMQKF